MLSVTGVNKDIFLNSNSIKITPVISAEWNQNIFNPPYLTVASGGTKQSLSKTSGPSITAVTDSNKHPNFDTYSYTINNSNNAITYTVNGTSGTKAYKIVTYATTDSSSPIMLNTLAQGSTRQFGSNNVELTSFGWTKIETYIGGAMGNDGVTPEDIASTFTYTMSANKLSTDTVATSQVYFTQPEVYITTYFDYQYGSVWSSDVAFSGFRPGESYVTTGNSAFNLPANFRKVTTDNLLKGHSNFYMPVSPLFSSPNFFVTSTPTPIYKHSLFTDISTFRYFVSDTNSGTSISGLYAEPVLMNKVVLKFNTYLSTPTVNVSVTLSDNSTITASNVTPDSTGTLLLYLNSNSLTTSQWSVMPKINDDGTLSNFISIKKITVSLSGTPSTNSDFSGYSNTYISTDKNRMHIVEVSPRLELDLTSYVMDFSINKSLDSKDTYMPISSTVTDDASITLSGIPQGDINNPIPVFSNISNYGSTKLKGLLKKNIKFYINHNLIEYADNTTSSTVAVNKLIPSGVFYSDSWQQNDIDSISIACFDVTRYLQTSPVSDYVSNFKDAFEVISNILDLSGFTDYDVDSLYAICNDPNSPININYYFCNSKDTTVADALNQIFLPYQVGAYIDNYGIMRFLSLSKIMQPIGGILRLYK